MVNIKLKGLEDLKMKITEMGSPQHTQKLFLDEICKKVPSANSERHKIKFINTSQSRFEIDPKSISADLYLKIIQAFK